MILVLTVTLIFSIFLGYKIISGVPPLLHTPLMSGMNALSGITVIGAITVFSLDTSPVVRAGAAAALVLAMVNVAGGFWVTGRMLNMFKTEKEDPDQEEVSS